MLSFNDKWWMMYWDKKHLSKYGRKRAMDLSIIPRQVKENWHGFSVERKFRLHC